MLRTRRRWQRGRRDGVGQPPVQWGWLPLWCRRVLTCRGDGGRRDSDGQGVVDDRCALDGKPCVQAGYGWGSLEFDAHCCL